MWRSWRRETGRAVPILRGCWRKTLALGASDGQQAALWLMDVLGES